MPRESARDTAELVAAARDGDRAAFEELVRATHADTYTLAYRLTGDEEDARDVVQEAYLRAYRGLRRFRGDAQFTTWMYRITANCAATHLGRRSRHRHHDLDEAASVPDGHPDRPAAAGRQRPATGCSPPSTGSPRFRAVVVLPRPPRAAARATAELGISSRRRVPAPCRKKPRALPAGGTACGLRCPGR